MNLTIGQRQQIEEILVTICEQLEVSNTQYEDAKQKYGAVAKWLIVPGTSLYQYSPNIHPQGSILLQTTVKPLGRDEFDVDLVCKLNISKGTSHAQVKEMVGARLRESKDYSEMLEPKNRCWRLNYAGAFHMDILPAIPDTVRGGTNILIPDSELKEWQESNPIGYAKWFEDCTKTARVLIFENMKKASVENLPANDSLVKTPLQRVVQLLKRNRDIVFSKDKDNAPISIIITTLAARAYRGEIDLYKTIFNVISGMPAGIQIENGVPKVKNPTHEEENFADKWEQDASLQKTFFSWLENFKRDLAALPIGQGVQAVKDALAPMFGAKFMEQVFERYAQKIENQRQANRLHVSPTTGLLGAVGIKVPKNTFYGD